MVLSFFAKLGFASNTKAKHQPSSRDLPHFNVELDTPPDFANDDLGLNSRSYEISGMDTSVFEQHAPAQRKTLHKCHDGFNEKADWACQVQESAKKELAQIEAEQARSSRRTMNKHVGLESRTAKAQAELLELVQAAEESGQVRVVPRGLHPSRQAAATQQTQDAVDGLLVLLRNAQTEGHVRILRRKSTEHVAMSGGGVLQLSRNGLRCTA